jgi:hypothetical protein
VENRQVSQHTRKAGRVSISRAHSERIHLSGAEPTSYSLSIGSAQTKIAAKRNAMNCDEIDEVA